MAGLNGESLGPARRAHAGVRLGMLSVPFKSTLPSEGEATGRLVDVHISGPSQATFTLRHAYISSEVGLPGVGIPLVGSIHVRDGHATVAVHTSVWWAAFMGLVASVTSLVGVALVVHGGGLWNVAWGVGLLATLYPSYRRAKGGIRSAAMDALWALERLSTTGQVDPWD